MEDMLCLAFMVFGLGFFLFVINHVISSSNADRQYDDYRKDLEYQRKLTEAREFGFGGPNRHTVKTLRVKQ
jgi:hypothetical protein